MNEANGSTRQNDEIKEETSNIWLEEEEKAIKAQAPIGDFEKVPVINLQFAENKIVRMKVDATKPFKKWDDAENKKTKAIIPVMGMGAKGLEKMVFFLNISNPVYKDIIHVCKEAPNKASVDIAIIQTGTKQTTQYALVKE